MEAEPSKAAVEEVGKSHTGDKTVSKAAMGDKTVSRVSFISFFIGHLKIFYEILKFKC